jgi:choline kinase/phosphatidylglycerophosphate synthase
MKGIILAAGKGKRLGLNIPKCLQTVGTKTILQRQLEALAAQGIQELVVVVGYQKEVVSKAVKRMWPHRVMFVENDDYSTTNTSYSLYLARKYMGEDFFYLNADVVFRPDLLDRLVTADGDAALAIQYKKCGAEEVKVIVNSSRIVNIGKDIDPSQCLGEFVGAALFRKSMNDRFIEALHLMISDGHSRDYFEGALQRITGDTVMTAVDITDIPCIEIDFPEDLERAIKNAPGFDVDGQKKSFNQKIKEARNIAQAPRIAQGENWYTEYFMRYFTIYFSVLFWKAGISANVITIWMGIVSLLGSIAFVFNNMWLVLLGWLLWMFAEILDCVDGEVARLSNTRSSLGGYIDHITHIFLNPMIALACGLHIFLIERTITNAVCTFLLYSGYIWNTNLRQLKKEEGGFPAAPFNKRSFIGVIRIIASQCFTLIGQMVIFPIALFLDFKTNYNFISHFLHVYTALLVCHISVTVTRDLCVMYKKDTENNKNSYVLK